MAISIDRLSGGNTPADGSDPRTFPAIWNATAAILEANVGTGGGGSITVSDTAPTDPAPENGDLWWKSDDGKLFVYYVDGDSSQWVDAAGRRLRCSLQRLQGMRASCGWIRLMVRCTPITLTLVGGLRSGLGRCLGLAGFCRLCLRPRRIRSRLRAQALRMLRV